MFNVVWYGLFKVFYLCLVITKLMNILVSFITGKVNLIPKTQLGYSIYKL